MDGFVADLRYGLRMLVRTPLLSLAAILTIGLGVGGATFGFSVLWAAVFDGVDVRDHDRFWSVVEARPQENSRGGWLPYLELLDVREAQRSFEGLEGYTSGTMNLAGEAGPPERYQGGFVTAGLLSMLGVRPILGRTFVEGEDAPGAPLRLVLGHDAWRNRFASDPGVLGRSVRVNGETAEVVGVLPEGFHFPYNEDLWVNARHDPATLGRRDAAMGVVGHVRPGVDPEVAGQELAAIARRIEAEHPDANEGVTLELMSFDRPPDQVVTMVGLLMVMVVGVLVVACANVANVLLARAVAREREVAVRSALGAHRWRVARQLLTETVVLGLVGGVVGLGVARVAMGWLDGSLQGNEAPYWIQFELDRPVLVFSTLVTLAAAVVAGTWPAVRASATDAGSMLRDESRGSSGLRMSRLTSALVVGELAVSCGLMIAGGLTLDALVGLNRIDLGFDPGGVMTARVGLFESDYPDEAARLRFFHDVADRLAAEPGVVSTAVTTALPGTPTDRSAVEIDGATYVQPADRPRTAVRWVSDGYFEAADQAPVEGRAFLRSESQGGDDDVVVVSRSFVDRHLGGGPALGRTLRLAGDTAAPWLRVVGVVPDVHPGVGGLGGGSGEPPRDGIYLPLGAANPRFATLMVRNQGAAETVAPAMRRAVAAVDPNLPLYWVMSLRGALNQGATFHRIFGTMFGAVAAVALFLSVVGLYGVIDFSVASRMREMGVRIAMGAQSRDVLGLVLGKVLLQLGVGVALGVGLGFGLAVPLSTFLYGVTVWNAPVYAGIVGLLAATALGAATLPAVRALRADPVAALRQ